MCGRYCFRHLGSATFSETWRHALGDFETRLKHLEAYHQIHRDVDPMSRHAFSDTSKITFSGMYPGAFCEIDIDKHIPILYIRRNSNNRVLSLQASSACRGRHAVMHQNHANAAMAKRPQ